MDNRKKGILCLVGATFFLAMMSAFVRMAGELPVMQKLLLRSMIMVVVSYAELKGSGVRCRLEKQYALPVILRGVLGTLAIACNFYAVDHMNLADANMLNKLSPFFTVLFSWLLLKEELRPGSILALFAAFAGALLIVKPGGSGFELLPALAGVLGGVLGGAAFTAVRASNLAGAPKPLIVFSLSLTSCILAFPSTAAHFVPMTIGQWASVTACGLCGAAGQFLNTRAYAYAAAGEISVFDYSQVLFSALIGFVLFGQIPDLLSAFGYCVIIGVGIAVFISGRKQKRSSRC